ncbi:MAG: NAD(P)-binding domain-containing protein, partial [Ignavibacteria bacterium]|nr:NAD(P)-binding domain-containing protein [Ignavibacteria bacterium]
MKIGFIGLGKMGFNMVQRLLNDGHEIVVWNRTEGAIKEAESKGAIAASSIEDLVNKLPEKKIVWLMVPSGKPVDENIDVIKNYLNKNDIIIDGGNSYWKETQQRAEKLAAIGI